MKRTPLRRKSPLRSKPTARKKPGPKPRKRPPMQRCDALARAIVLARGVCEAKGTRWHPVCRGPLQWAHIQSRRYHWVRHLEENAMCLCAGAHMYFTHRPLAWIDFVGEARWLALKHLIDEHSGEKIDWKAREKMLLLRARALGVAP